jgi:hypothetical protein
VIYTDRIAVGSQARSIGISCSTITDVQIEGRSLTSGGGFIGGGFGLKGAAEGMLAASVLNAVTTKKAQWVIIRIVSEEGWADFRLPDYDEATVKLALRMLSDHAFYNQARKAEIGRPSDSITIDSETKPEDDLVSKLERIAKLREAGVLDDAEFAAAKRHLLDSLSE